MEKHTQRMTTAQLGLLAIFALELIADAVEQLHVALVGILLETVDESIGHCSCGFALDGSVGPDTWLESWNRAEFRVEPVQPRGTYEVC